MKENEQMIVYKRGKSIISTSLALTAVVIASCMVGFKISKDQFEMKQQREKMNIALAEYREKVEEEELELKKELYEEKLKILLAEAETTRKVVKPTSVTYTSRGTRVTRNVSNYNTEIESLATENNNEAPTEYKAVYDVTATAYCLCEKCCGKTPDNPRYGETSSGLVIVPGTGMKVIAVDPKLIPLGSKVYVEGLNGAKDYGYAIAADQGSAIKNNKIDLYMDTHQQALNWGRKTVRVYVVE